MAETPTDHAEAYGLSQDVAADMEDPECPAIDAVHGEDRTRIPEQADREAHGRKTMQKIREEFSGRHRGGTH
jgi:hypothetical protein